MTDKFIMKVLKNRVVDTKKYRYCAGEALRDGKYLCIIKRIDKNLLDTTETLNKDNWVEVFAKE